jgi:photosystem II stability/assembly factor-like uncharacterized protein
MRAYLLGTETFSVFGTCRPRSEEAMRRIHALAPSLIIAAAGGCARTGSVVQQNGAAAPVALEKSPPPRQVPTPTTIDYDYTLRKGRKNVIRFGPPPPGYWRITGDAVPGWRPEHMQNPSPADGPGVWAPLGPRPIANEYWSGNANASGRVVSVAVHPTNTATVYIGSASGGVWKTTDSGMNWAPITDELSTLNHGSIAIDPSNPDTIYAGTGEYTTSSGGDGLFRSLDAGATWSRIGTATQVGSNCSKVAVDPADSQRIYVTGTAGFVRSTDGGNSWSTRLSGSCSDMVVNPAQPQTIFVARHGDGVYRSLDGGNTITELTSGLPLTGARRIVLAIAQSNPQVVYAAYANSGGGLLGLYKTTNGGDTWVRLNNTPNFPDPQAWYDMCIAVDPANENIVYAGGVFPTYAEAGIIRTTDGGNSWSDITIAGGTQVHPDIQTLTVAGNTLWVGCDGGVWKTTSPGVSWTNCNATLTLTQNYQIALNPNNPAQIIGGTQDNGTVQRMSSDTWPQIFTGDGGYAAYDPTLTTRRYVTYVYLSIYRLSSGPAANISGPWGSDAREFISPMVMDPGSPTTLVAGSNRVWRTANASGTPTWTALSTTSVAAGASLTSVAVAPGAPNTIYAGGSNGRIGVTTTGTTWLDRSGGLSSAEVSDFCIDPLNPGTCYVSFAAASGTRIARTDNHGQNWTNLTGTLPSGARAKALAVDWRFNPPMLYVGTGSGVYVSNNHGATWVKDGADLPNVNIGDLQIDRTHNTLSAGTYGRGLWRMILPTPPSPCYANCDGSTTAPILNVADFTCFLQRFAAGESYANCDESTQPPVLNVADFTCFLQSFATGCP